LFEIQDWQPYILSLHNMNANSVSDVKDGDGTVRRAHLTGSGKDSEVSLAVYVKWKKGVLSKDEVMTVVSL
jgi:hypothetical protein